MSTSPGPSPSDPYAHPDIDEVIGRALREDLRDIGDITCQALVPSSARLHATITAKSPGVVCGLPLFARVVAALGGRLDHLTFLADGSLAAAGQIVLQCDGDATVLLIAERTALNLCQRLSGTASMTRRYVEAVHGTRAQVFDTRKTTPGLRLLEKHAVQCGGGHNHRMGLYDQILIKENHIALMTGDGPATATRLEGGFPGSTAAQAVARCRQQRGSQVVIEVEIEDLADLEAVIAAGADLVLLDNMAPDLLAQAVRRRDQAHGLGRTVQLEASGGITLATIRAVAQTGVERISVGALTHSVEALDLSMRCRSAVSAGSG
jgi:nicotinate-nucleotide pyrophosphorylase (carboxylating)